MTSLHLLVWRLFLVLWLIWAPENWNYRHYRTYLCRYLKTCGFYIFPEYYLFQPEVKLRVTFRTAAFNNGVRSFYRTLQTNNTFYCLRSPLIATKPIYARDGEAFHVWSLFLDPKYMTVYAKVEYDWPFFRPLIQSRQGLLGWVRLSPREDLQPIFVSSAKVDRKNFSPIAKFLVFLMKTMSQRWPLWYIASDGKLFS